MASRKASYSTGLAVGAVLLLGIAVFLNKTISNVGVGRFDLTEDKIYTVSDSAKNIMAALDVPVQVSYYVTPKDDMPSGLKSLQQDVVDKLSELSIASGGRLEYKVVDPNETEELAETLAKKGVRPFQVQSVDRDELAVKLVYSAIGIAYKDKPDAVLPQILPESLSNFEYELLSNVLRITRESAPIVAIYSTTEAVDPQMMQLYMQMGQQPPPPADNFTGVPEILRGEGYDIRPVQLTADNAIPDDTETLIVLAPRDLNERQRYEIGAFLRKGGNVIIGAQALTFDYNPSQRGGFDFSARPQTLTINDLLTEYGVRIDDRPLMDTQVATLAIPRTVTVAGLRLQTSEPVQAPMQIRILGDGLNKDVPFAAGVPEMLYLWGTQLILDDERLAANELTATPILEGSDNTWVVGRSSGLLTGADMDPDANDPIARPLLGVMLEGTFPDPYAEAGVPAWPGAESDSTYVAESGVPDEDVQPGRLIVTGCAKLFEDMLLQQQGHSLFVLNAVDAVTLGDELIALRSRSFERRTLEDASDGKRLGFRLANMALVPALVIVFGLSRKFKRDSESNAYAARMRQSTAGGKA